MSKKKLPIDIVYLKRCKESSPESKFEWLASALEFAHVKKRIVKTK